MTNGEPEPFRMPIDEDANDPAGEAPEDRGDEARDDRGDEAQGDRGDEAQGDRDGGGEDVEGVEDADAVWTTAEDASSSQDVWDVDPIEGDVWADDAEQRKPSMTADPTVDTGEDPVEDSAPASDGAAGGDDEEGPDDGVWTLDVVQGSEKTDDAEAPLAETANPRSDAGWHDLEAENEPPWSVPDLPLQRRDEDDEDVDDDAPWSSGPVNDADDVDDEHDVHDMDDVGDVDDDDAPWSSGTTDVTGGDPADDAPWSSGTTDTDEADTVDMPADVVAAEVHDALGDLLGNDTEDPAPVPTDDAALVPTGDTTPVPAEDAAGGSDPLDELADLDLDQFDDLAPPPGTADTPEATADADDEDLDAAETPDEDADDETPDDEDADDETPDDATADDQQQLDAPTAAREVMEPGNVSFSSGGKKKKRGLFG